MTTSIGRCPVCGALAATNQTFCRRCFEPLHVAAQLAPQEPATGDTCIIYRACTGEALLVLSPNVLEYSAAKLAFATSWNNLAAITWVGGEQWLRLYQTPTTLRMPLGSASTWFSAQTRSIPLGPFGYPANALHADLLRFAPQLRR